MLVIPPQPHRPGDRGQAGRGRAHQRLNATAETMTAATTAIASWVRLLAHWRRRTQTPTSTVLPGETLSVSTWPVRILVNPVPDGGL